jgi:hypothetical protein
LEYAAWERAPLASLVTKIVADNFWRGGRARKLRELPCNERGFFASSMQNLQELDKACASKLGSLPAKKNNAFAK